MLCLNLRHIHCKKLLKFGEKYDIMNYQILRLISALTGTQQFRIPNSELKNPSRQGHHNYALRITHYALRITHYKQRIKKCQRAKAD